MAWDRSERITGHSSPTWFYTPESLAAPATETAPDGAASRSSDAPGIVRR
jgi:hypothetical protein